MLSVLLLAVIAACVAAQLGIAPKLRRRQQLGGEEMVLEMRGA